MHPHGHPAKCVHNMYTFCQSFMPIERHLHWTCYGKKIGKTSKAVTEQLLFKPAGQQTPLQTRLHGEELEDLRSAQLNHLHPTYFRCHGNPLDTVQLAIQLVPGLVSCTILALPTSWRCDDERISVDASQTQEPALLLSFSAYPMGVKSA